MANTPEQERKLNELLKGRLKDQRTYNEALKETKSLNETILDSLAAQNDLGDISERRLRSEKDLVSEIQQQKATLADAESNRADLRKRQMEAYRAGEIDIAVQLGIQAKKQATLIDLGKNQINNVEKELQLREELDKQIKKILPLIKGLQSIPFVGKFIEAEKAAGAMEDSIRKGGTGMQGLLQYTKDVVKENKTAIMGAIGMKTAKSVFNFMVEGIKKVSELQTAFSNNFGLSDEAAQGMRDKMASIANSTGRVGINSMTTQQAFMDLNEQFGTASTVLRDDIVAETATLMKFTNMSAEAAGRFAMQANVTGQNMSEITDQARAAVVEGEKERGVRVNINKVLDEAGKTTGLIAANMGFNVQAIAKSITVAKQFGLTLKDLASISSNMLDFQSSIEAELQAELFTGKQLNLEKARLAALTGDYETLTKEVMNNVGSELEFAQMNVLQKEKLAQALGMNVDQMSDLVFKNKNLAKLAEEAREAGNEELTQSLEKRNLADQMNDATEKLQMLFVELMEGPLGTVANIFIQMAESTGLLYTLMGAIAVIKLGGLISGMLSLGGALAAAGVGSTALMSGLTLGIGAAAIIAGIVAITAAYKKSKKDVQSADDAMIGSDGGLMVSGPKGSIQLNKDDQVIAGTNLGGGGKAASNPEAEQRNKEFQRLSLNYLKQIAATNSTAGAIASVVYSGFDAVKADTHYGTKFN